MADYKQMYCFMAREADRALTELEKDNTASARAILQQALLRAEEFYTAEETTVAAWKPHLIQTK